MSEIEKMYKNAEIEPKYIEGENLMEYSYGTLKYPPFTAEKQIFLLQWLLDKTDLYLHRHKTDFTYSIASDNYAVNKYKDFKESIAEFINAAWQDLTEEEKQQVKGILE